MSDLPSILDRYPSLDDWVRIDAADTVTVLTGKVELGQGLVAAIRRIGAEELDLRLDQVLVETADTARGLDEGITAGSQSMEQSGAAIRHAAAFARECLLELAAAELAVGVAGLTLHDGVIATADGRRSTTYWKLIGGHRFDRDVATSVAPKRPEEYRIVGTAGPRPELNEMVTGRLTYLGETIPAGCLYGRVVRPPHASARLESFEPNRAEAVDGVVAVVHDGRFLGIVAESDWAADEAASLLERDCRWSGLNDVPPLAGPEAATWLKARVARTYPVIDGVPVDGPVPEPTMPGDDERLVAASYSRPFLMHAALGPSTAMAQWRDGTVDVWSHTQGPYLLRDAIARALGLLPEHVRVVHVRHAGAYGHNGADDAAVDAVILSRAVPGRSVLVRWSRRDEHLWEPYGPAMAIEMRAHLDASGCIAHWSHEVWSPEHFGRPNSRDPIAAQLLAPVPPPRAAVRPVLNFHGPVHRNADPLYDLPSRRIVMHVIDDHPIRVSALRATGAHPNVFALESFIDEAAHAVGRDAVDFRLAHLSDPRARAVIEAAAHAVGWEGGARRRFGHGLGLAFARYRNVGCYAAVAAEVDVDDVTATARVRRLVIAADAGQVVDPDGLQGQLEGGAIQALSWTMIEQIAATREAVVSLDWDTYPVVRFPDVPEVETILLNRPGAPYLGAGEATLGPASAAIANGLFNAVGARVRDLPITPARIRAALERQS